jgi:hypothetical protein
MDGQLATTVQGYRWKDLLLGPLLATSRLVRERLRKLVALAVFSRLAGVNVAIVHPPPTTPTADEFPASRYARRQLVLRS